MGWIRLNYGELPTRKQFDEQYFRAVGDDTFHMHLKGSDADCFFAHTSWHTTPDNYDADDLYDIVEELAQAFGDGAECAGDLASSILYTLEIEWI